MALTRKYLKELGIESEKIDLIIDAHADVVDALKEERDALKAKGTEAEELKAKVAELEKRNDNGDEWREKYEKEKEAFEAYKTEQTSKQEKTDKINAYREILKGLGIAEKRIDAILKVTDVEALELADGKLKDADKLTENIKTEWEEFIPEVNLQGAKTEHGAGGSGAVDLDALSIEDYISARNK